MAAGRAEGGNLESEAAYDNPNRHAPQEEHLLFEGGAKGEQSSERATPAEARHR